VNAPSARFALVVPTRDRPEFLAFCLRSLARQTSGDFQVIVSDNALARPADAAFAPYRDDPRFYLIRPPKPLAMPDHWDFALSHARAEYVGVVIDKTVLAPQALELAARTLDRGEREIVSWWNDGYMLEDEDAGLARGRFSPLRAPVPASDFDPRQELSERLAFLRRRGEDGVHYFRGKLCFGLYAAGLIARIRQRLGRVCPPISPDYTSMTAALNEARDAIDLGRSLQLSFISRVSNGATVSRAVARARSFLVEVDPDGSMIAGMPIPHAFASVHNLVAADYVNVSRHWSGAAIDVARLAQWAALDLAGVDWGDEPEQQQLQIAAVRRAMAEAPVGLRLCLAAGQLARVALREARPVAGRLARQLGLRRETSLPEGSQGGPTHFNSILDAAEELGALAVADRRAA
jgi:hypothetical protein